MKLLPFDDPLWDKLGSRVGSGRRVVDWIKRLADQPGDTDVLQEINALIGTESTTWPVAYITTPYLAEAAERSKISEKAEHALMIGLSFMYSGASSIDECPKECPAEAFPAYRESLNRGISLLVQVAPSAEDEGHARWLVAALTALLGWPRMGDLLTYEFCIHCGEPLMEK